MPRKLQHPVPENLLVHIGDITVSFALLESTIQSVIWSFLSDRQRIGQIVTAELSFKNLRALAISLAKERYGDGAPVFVALKELMKRAAIAEEKRNQITHSLWAAGTTAGTITRIKTTAKEARGIHVHFENVGGTDLAALAVELKELAAAIQQFWLELLGSPGNPEPTSG